MARIIILRDEVDVRRWRKVEIELRKRGVTEKIRAAWLEESKRTFEMHALPTIDISIPLPKGLTTEQEDEIENTIREALVRWGKAVNAAHDRTLEFFITEKLKQLLGS